MYSDYNAVGSHSTFSSKSLYLWVIRLWTALCLPTLCFACVVEPNQVKYGITLLPLIFGMISLTANMKHSTGDQNKTCIDVDTFGILYKCLLLWLISHTEICLSLNCAAFSMFAVDLSLFYFFSFLVCKQCFLVGFFFKLWLLLWQEHVLQLWQTS